MKIKVILLSCAIFGACTKKPEVTFDGLNSKLSESKSSMATVTTLQVVNDQLVIQGTRLDGVQSIKITGPNSFNESFSIESINANQIVANGLKNIAFAVGKVFSLIISDAHGASTFSVTFTLQDGAVTANKIADGAVTAAKLADMGAANGDALIYNSVSGLWEAKPLSGLDFKGTWNASTNTPTLSDGGGSTFPGAGDYYVVDTAGSTGLDTISTWNSGDWVIYNGSTWDRIVNSSTITSFNGRQGAVMPQAGDYSIEDLGNVDTTGATLNSVLKFDGSNWVVGVDDDSGVAANSVDSSSIQDGTISDSDLAGGIDQSKITNLSADLAGKLSLGGGTMTGDITFNSTQTFDGVDVSNLKTQADLNTSNITTNTTNISSNTTALGSKVDTSTTVNGQALSSNITLDSDDISEGSTNFYFTDTRAKTASVVNSTAGSEMDQAPSVSSIKSYIATQITGSGDVKSDGTVAMSADFDFGNNKAKFKSDNTNYVELIAPNTLGATYTLTLPGDDGTLNQVLTTDGNGVLSWSTAASGSGDFKADGTVAMTGDLDLGAQNITNVALVDGVDVASLKTQSDNNVTALSSKVNTSTTVNGQALSSNVVLDSDDVAEGISNLYFTDARAKSSAVINSTAGSESDQAASVAAMKSFVTSSVSTGNSSKADKTTTVNGQALSSNITLDTDDVAQGSVNLYYTATQAKTDVVLNSTAGSETDQAASVAAMKSYVAAQTAGAGTGDLKSDGTVAMTADFDLGAQKIVNASGVSVKGDASTTLTGTVEVSGTSLIGTGTAFTSELAVGDVIEVSNTSFEVSSITNDTTATLSTSATIASGQTLNKLNLILAVNKNDNSDALNVLSNGNIGVGVIAPSEKLDVAGNVKATSFIGDGSGLTGITSSTTSNSGETIIESDSDASGDESISFKTAGSTKATIDTAGNLKLGTDLGYGASELAIAIGNGSAPAVLALGEDSSNNSNIKWDNTNNLLSFGTKSAGTDYQDTLVIKDGNVGIGITAPETPFHVYNEEMATAGGTSRKLGSFHQLINSPSDSSTNFLTSHSYAETDPGNISNYSVIIASAGAAFHHGTGTVNDQRGTNASARNKGTGSILIAKGGEFTAANDSTGHITDAISEQLVGSNSGTMTNFYGSKLNFSNTGTIENTYGAFIGDITSGTQTNTPFSFYAADPNAFNYFAGNVGIGTEQPMEKLEVKDGNISISNGVKKHVSLTNSSSNGMIHMTDAAGNQVVRIYTAGDSWFNGGNVGIGTASPSTHLELAGGAGGPHGLNLAEDPLASNYSKRLFFSNGTAGESITVFNDSGDLDFYGGGTPGISSGSNKLMTLTSSGFLGVGIDNPSTKLHLDDSSGSANIRIDRNLSTDTAGITFHQKSNADYWHIGTLAGADGASTGADDNFTIFANGGAGAGLSIDHATGRVGVGTTTPRTQLDVTSTFNVAVSDNTSSTNMQMFTKIDGENDLNHANTNGWLFSARGDSYAGNPSQVNDFGLHFYNGTSQTNKLFIEHDTGNIGVGTTTPTEKLEVAGRVVASSVREEWTITTVTDNGMTLALGANVMLDVSGGAYALTLPASPVNGDVVKFVHAAGSLATNSVTLNPGTGDTIVTDTDLVLDVDNVSIELIFFDANGDGDGDWRLF